MTYEWKVPENLHSVAWRMSGKFQRTYREACPSSASSHERYYIPRTTPPVHTCTYRQPRTSMSFLRKFTWTLYYMPHPTPPHPPDVYKTPRPSKGRGPTIYICIYTSVKQILDWEMANFFFHRHTIYMNLLARGELWLISTGWSKTYAARKGWESYPPIYGKFTYLFQVSSI